MRPSPRLWIAVVAAIAVLAGLTVFAVTRRPTQTGRTAGAQTGRTAGAQTGRTAAPTMPFHPTNVTVTGDTFLSWALMDRRTGQIWGSSTMDQTSWTASMIKAWLAADYLRRASEQYQTPSADMLHTIEIMIRDSDNAAASTLYQLNGEADSINRLISLCGLTDSSPNPAGWAVTNLSARDTVRMGTCIAGGEGAGPQWTDWLLTQMRSVRGEGDFGIRDALPPAQAATVAIKNGYEDFSGGDGLYHVNCLAIGDTWTLAVMQQYQPTADWDTDFPRGEKGCTRVAAELLAAA
jgi:Beta-lactamase enzyme family